MHLPIPEGEVLGFQDQSDGFGFAGLEMNPFEAAEVLFVSRNAGHEFVRVELNNFVAFARAGVGYVERDGNTWALPYGRATAPLCSGRAKTLTPPSPRGRGRQDRSTNLRADLEIAVRECGVTQAVTEKIKRAVDARPFTLPLRARFGRKVVGDLPDCLWESNC